MARRLSRTPGAIKQRARRRALAKTSPEERQARVREYAWKPGQSGNPGGLPKSVKILRDLIAERTDNGVELVDLACAAMRGEIDGVSREYAHNWLADRYFGKPKQEVHVEGTITAEHRALVAALQLSPHERRDRIAELEARRLPAPADPEPEAANGHTNGHAVGG